MKQFTMTIIISLVVINSSFASNLFCYTAEDDARFYVRCPITQPSKSEKATDYVVGAAQGLAAVVPRHVALVKVDGAELTAAEYIELKGGESSDSLKIQFIPGSGYHCGISRAGSNLMKQSWFVTPTPENDISNYEGAIERETVTVLVICRGKVPSTVDEMESFRCSSSQSDFTAEGKLTDAAFREYKDILGTVEMERSVTLNDVLRVKSDEEWYISDASLRDAWIHSNAVYVSLDTVYAISYDCLTVEQQEYVNSGKIGRVWSNTKNVLKDSIKLLGN